MFKTTSILTVIGARSAALLCGCGGTVKPVERIQNADIRNSVYSIFGNMLCDATEKNAMKQLSHDQNYSSKTMNCNLLLKNPDLLLNGMITANVDKPLTEAYEAMVLSLRISVRTGQDV